MTVNGDESLHDGASTGTDEGPGGIPAALVGRDKAGDEVAPPAASQPGSDDALSPADTGSSAADSGGRGTSASGSGIPDDTRSSSASGSLQLA